MSTIDFEEVKAKVSIVDGLQKLGIDNLQVRNGQLRGSCPCCNDQNPRAFVVTVAKGVWFCFSCKEGGDVLTLVAKVKGISVREAAQWLIEDTPTTKPAAPQEQQERTQPFHSLSYLEPEHEAVLAVGFNPAFAKRVGIGYAPKGVARGSVLLPIRDEQGRLEGYVGVQEVTYLPADFQLPENVVQLKKA